MRKAEFVAMVSKRSGLSKKDSQVALEAVLESIQDSLVDKEGVNFIGFGSFFTARREARNVKVPKSEKIVEVPSRVVVKFKPGKALREAVSKSG